MISQLQPAWKSLARVSLGSVSHWRLFIVWIGVTLIPTAVVSVPVGRLLSAQLDHSAYSALWAQTLNVPVVGDLLLNSMETQPLLEGALVVSLLLTLLFWPFLTGMALATAREGRTLQFLPLIQGGVRDYGRMLRMLLWSLVPLGIAAASGGWALHVVNKRARVAILESHVSHERLMAMILLLVLLVVAHATTEAGRAQFALDSSRRSAVKAWWRGLRAVVGRPIASLGSYVLITALGFALIALLGIARFNLSHAGFPGLLFALVMTELIAVAAIWMRVARLLALVHIAGQSVSAKI